MKLLKSLPLKPSYFEEIRKETDRIFYGVIYKPLLEVLKENGEKTNTKATALADAVASGRVWFQDGRFYGDFNANISKQLYEIGARFNKKSATWTYDGALPPEVSIAMVQAQARYEKLKADLLSTLNSIVLGKIDQISKVPTKYVESIELMDFDFRKAAKEITVAPQLNEDQVGVIAADWGHNLDLYIKNWAANDIIELREKVMKEAFQGRRAQSLSRLIMDNYMVSKRKAEFLARQETGLLMAKFHETRFKSIGSTRYKWSTSQDERVREDHKALNGKIFSWDNPPVTNRKTGKRSNPSEDFGCRCVAIAIIE